MLKLLVYVLIKHKAVFDPMDYYCVWTNMVAECVKTMWKSSPVPGVEFHVVYWKPWGKEVKLGQVHRIPVAAEKGRGEFDLRGLFMFLVHSSTWRYVIDASLILLCVASFAPQCETGVFRSSHLGECIGKQSLFLRCEKHCGRDRNRVIKKRRWPSGSGQTPTESDDHSVCVCVCVSPAVKGDDCSCVFDLKTAGGLPRPDPLPTPS